MLGRQSRGHPLPGLLAEGLPAAADLGKEHIDDKELGHPGGHRAQLEGALIGAALEDHVGKGGGGRFGEMRDQDDPWPPCSRTTSSRSSSSLVEPE